METAGVCGIQVAAQGLLGSSGSLPDLDSPSCDALEGLGELSIACCSEESRGETPGREDSRIDPPDGELDPDGEKTKEKKGLGKEVLLLMQALNALASPEEKLAALCKKYADLVSMGSLPIQDFILWIQINMKCTMRVKSINLREYMIFLLLLFLLLYIITAPLA